MSENEKVVAIKNKVISILKEANDVGLVFSEIYRVEKLDRWNRDMEKFIQIKGRLNFEAGTMKFEINMEDKP